MTPRPKSNLLSLQGRWQLYDLAADPGELRDLSAAHPDVMTRLIAAWERYVRDNGVIVSTEPLAY